jgi:Holliday junction resolvase RusA-like endonuclease
LSESVTIVIGGEPVAKARPRATRRGSIYTPAHSRKFEAHGRLAAQQAMDGRPPIAGPVRAEILIDLPVPASWSAKRQAAALAADILPTTRPDCDNYVKSALDAINGIVVTDDALVVELAAFKFYAQIPKLTIIVTELPAAAAQPKKSPGGSDSAPRTYSSSPVSEGPHHDPRLQTTAGKCDQRRAPSRGRLANSRHQCPGAKTRRITRAREILSPKMRSPFVSRNGTKMTCATSR